MATTSDDLSSGDELGMSEFAKRRSDAKYLTAAGGVLYLTENGKRRMALVPSRLAEPLQQLLEVYRGSVDLAVERLETTVNHAQNPQTEMTQALAEHSGQERTLRAVTDHAQPTGPPEQDVAFVRDDP